MKLFNRFLAISFMALTCIILASCGEQDHSNPQSVAESALSFYDSGDYAGLKTLVNPQNEPLLGEMDKMAEMAAKYVEKNGQQKTESVERTFKEMKDGLSGGELNEGSKSAKVYFKSERWPLCVVLEKVDGKWYFERFK